VDPVDAFNRESFFVNRIALLSVVAAWGLGLPAAPAAEPIPAHREAQIREAAPEKPRLAPRQPRTVLIWNTPPVFMEKDPHKGYCIPYGEAAMRILGEKTGAYRAVVSDDLSVFLPESLQQFDAVVLNNSSGPWIRPTEPDMAKFPGLGDQDTVERLLHRSLLNWLSGGRGIVAYHYAIGANRHWPEFQELLGGKFTGHPWNEEVGIKVEEPDHPLVAAFDGQDFRLADEIYEFGDPYDRSKLRVLLSLDTARTNMDVPWIHRKDGDFAQAWVKPYGKGRIFYTGFGHRTEIYWNPAILQFYLDGIQFACGDLEAPTSARTEDDATAPRPPEGFVALFDGKTLDGWDGDRSLWSVRDGAITGQTTAETKLNRNEFLIWNEEVENFELRLKFRLEGGNSGIYYRARKRTSEDKGVDPLIGTQADFDASGRWTGVIMEYLLRDVLAERGQRVVIDEPGRKQVVGSIGDPADLLQAVKRNDWNDYRLVARGGRVTLQINGVTMCELDDRDPRRLARGRLALQVHVGPPMNVQFKEIYLRAF
jgi:type 1 glutamine amidotransferase